MGRRLAVLVAGALLGGLLAAAPAPAADPGRWTLVRVSEIPLVYYQGVSDGPARELWFSGFLGVWRTDRDLRQGAANPDVIPQAVKDTEGYNHIGDLDYDGAEGGRLLLPLECFYPGTPNAGNTCPRTGAIGTGSIGVADPQTLAWRYHVRLDQAEIKKAMWAETTPDGALWTQDGQDLLRYALADVSPANAAPGGREIRPTRRLTGAVPPTGITGATFHAGRLFVAGQRGRRLQVWSIDLTTGSRRLEAERQVAGESEGLATVQALGGLLHWQVMPFAPGAEPTFGTGAGALLTFAPAGSADARRRPRATARPVRASRRSADVDVACALPCTVRVRVTAPGRRGALGARTVRLPRGGTTRARIVLRRRAPAGLRRVVVGGAATDERGRRSLVRRAVALRRVRR